MIMMKKILTAHKIAKISLWTNSPKLRAAKIKGFTVHIFVANSLGVCCYRKLLKLDNQYLAKFLQK